jgi:hypothetical protein
MKSAKAAQEKEAIANRTEESPWGILLLAFFGRVRCNRQAEVARRNMNEIIICTVHNRKLEVSDLMHYYNIPTN